MLKVCKTCKWWKQDEMIGNQIAGTCQNYGMIFRDCSYNEKPSETKIMKPDGVYQFEEGGGSGDFITGPEFGCIHHQET